MTEQQKFLIVFNIIKEKGKLSDNLESWAYKGIKASITDGGAIRLIRLGDSAIQQNYDNSITYFGKTSEHILDALIQKL
jgi:hypothetical protein